MPSIYLQNPLQKKKYFWYNLLNNKLYEYFGITDSDKEIRSAGNELKQFTKRKFQTSDTLWKNIFQWTTILLAFIAAISSIIQNCQNSLHHKELLKKTQNVKVINFNNLLDSLNIDNKNNTDKILNILVNSNFKITIENYTKSKFDSSNKEKEKNK